MKKKLSCFARTAFLSAVLLLAGGGGTARADVPQESKNAVYGIVSDQDGPVVGASVVEKGNPGNGTATDLDGRYSLRVSPNATLEISYLGYATQSVAVNGRSEINVTLQESLNELDELVVVGYGSQRRESLTGSLQTLNSSKLVTQSTPSVENLLSGKAPGVYVAPGSGEPGSRGNIIIRGKTSINGGVDPLWVVDGVIVGTASNYALNPSDIENMTILKDAASTAIYGSQGANGVIVVTTKNAQSDKLVVNASANFGVSSLDNGNLEVMNGAELYDYWKSFSNQETVAFPRWNEQLRDANYNWWDLATHTGFTQDYNVSIAGGNEKLRSYFSLGYYDEDGAVKGYQFSRYSMRYRTEFKPVKWLSVKPSVSGSRRDVDDRQYSINAMYSNLPWDSPYLSDGTPTPHHSDTWVNSNSTNYLYDLQYNFSGSTRYSLSGNFDFDIRFTPWLTFSSVNNLTWEDYAFNSYMDARTENVSEDEPGVNGRVNEDDQKTTRRYTNQIIRFTNNFGAHAISALAAYEYRDYEYKNLSIAGTSIASGFNVLEATSKAEKTKGVVDASAVKSYLFNANYAYDSKYLVQFSARRDGASNLGDNARYGNFFSISGGWIINRENFFQADWVDLLKLRAAYGSVGNLPTSLYPQYDLYSVSVNYNGTPSALISQIGNPNLAWEKTYTTGVGLDFSFLGRYRVNLDYYDKQTSNILFNVPITGIVGVPNVWQNIGEMQNRGFEVLLGANIIESKDWNWSVDFNLGLNRNKVQKLYGDKKEIIAGDGSGIAGAANKLLKQGYDVDTWYVREWAGVNPENGAPQWYKTDTDGNRVITNEYAQADQVAKGAYTPDFFGGFSTSLSWKQLDLNAVFGYSVGGTIYNYSRLEFDSDGAYTDRNQMKLMSGWSRWEKPGDIATHPKPAYNNTSKSNLSSSRFLEDASYLKLRSLSIGYNLALPQYQIKSVRLSLTAENLFTITDYSGVDPEIPVRVSGNTSSVTGVTGVSNYPITRKFMLGVNFTF